MITFPPKNIGVTKQYLFDFSSELPPGITISSTVSCVITSTVISGVDANASSMVGPLAVYSTNPPIIAVQVTGGVAGVVYKLKLLAFATDFYTYDLEASLAVIP